MDILVMTTNPSDSVSWSARRRADRWSRVMDWHDWARDLNTQGKLPWAWGTSQIYSSAEPSGVSHGLVGVFRTNSLEEFSQILESDPLRTVSDHLTVPLAKLENDFSEDSQRFETVKANLFRDDLTSMMKFGEYEAMMASAPEFVGKWEPSIPANAAVDFDEKAGPNAPIDYLVHGFNPDSYIDSWDDMRSLMHYQKVQWWHHYTWMLSTRGIKTHTWGTNDFCTTITNQEKSAAAVDIFRTASYEEFTEVFALDPIRDDSLYQVTPLRNIADQREADARRAARARGVRVDLVQTAGA